MKHCRSSRFMVHNVSRTIVGSGFLPICLLENQQCFSSQITIIPVHRCWNGANNVLCVEYFFAPLTVLLNFIVFSTILNTKSLKKVPSMLLVSNLAIATSLSEFILSLLLVCVMQCLIKSSSVPWISCVRFSAFCDVVVNS